MLIFLIGFMGSGKTTLGKQLAQEKGYFFLDLDEYIEQKTQQSISSLFETVGENVFRKIEREALLAIIAEYLDLSEKIMLVSCGGGTPCFFDNHLKMKEVGISVYLQENEKVLAQRLRQLQNTRPLLQAISEAEILPFVKNLLQKRNAEYLKATKILASPTIEKLYQYISETLS